MTLFEAILMGIIQGLTEFLPVSSSGHLAIGSALFNLKTESGVLFEVVLHLGTLVAIFVAFWSEIWILIKSGLRILKNTWDYTSYHMIKRGNKDKTAPIIIEDEHQRFVMLIIVATIPTVIVALVLEKLILHAFTSLIFPAVGLLITATLLLLTTKMRSGALTEENVSFKKAMFVGLIQGFATFPGISRAGSTIVAGLFTGMSKDFIVKFSFIMSIPAILGATILQVLRFESTEPINEMIISYSAGMIASALVGYICIKVLLEIVRKGKIHYFAYYCYTVGILLLFVTLGGYHG
ncbi:undecaprenyl-diphosphate phosphatase [Petrocella sp. FN5]|uniref:undecaprenyl-diphosphate phosphatase n=1 Tax=Petrocella sp. FN5 TaxID=3032002 RepID=UPI0023DC4767|nr:undecaprenyl-diphosphate phosphatase [Petrocella sp. FN5]MDF1616986.1 undecaprenyl-diphosphate phosphatase [Petrocella sp. FN5]